MSFIVASFIAFLLRQRPTEHPRLIRAVVPSLGTATELVSAGALLRGDNDGLRPDEQRQKDDLLPTANELRAPRIYVLLCAPSIATRFRDRTSSAMDLGLRMVPALNARKRPRPQCSTTLPPGV